MAHITSFAVEGLVGRKGLYAEHLNSDVNIFFGLNGSGKTSLLKLLHSAMANRTTGLENIAFRRAEVTIYSVKLGLEITRTLSSDASDLALRPQLAIDEDLFGMPQIRPVRVVPTNLEWSTTPDTKPAAASWAHRYLPTVRAYIDPALARTVGYQDWFEYGRGDPAIQAERGEQRIEEQFAQLVQQLWDRYSAEVGAEVRRAQADGLASILRSVLATKATSADDVFIEPELALQRVRSFLKRQGSGSVLRSSSGFLERLGRDEQLRSVVRDINDVEQQIESATAARDRLEGLIQEMFSGGKKVRFPETGPITVDIGSDRQIPLKALSSGEKQVLRIFIETLLADVNSLIIDEPELSMHIDWQRSLVGAMRELNPRGQLILATHSPEIMAEVEDSRIFKL